MLALNAKSGDLHLNFQWSVGAMNAVLENFEYLVKAMDAFLQKSAQVHRMCTTSEFPQTPGTPPGPFFPGTSGLKKFQGASYKGNFHFILF